MERLIIAGVILILMCIFDRNMLRVELDKVAKFLGFMACLVVVQLAMGSYSYQGIPSAPEHAGIRTFWLAMVWWEDMFYAVPLYYGAKLLEIDKYKINKYFYYIFVALMSIDFGLGHLYQGVPAVFITAYYPYFISLRYGKSVGFGTVVFCHIIYDFTITALMRYGHLMY